MSATESTPGGQVPHAANAPTWAVGPVTCGKTCCAKMIAVLGVLASWSPTRLGWLRSLLGSSSKRMGSSSVTPVHTITGPPPPAPDELLAPTGSPPLAPLETDV